MEAAQTALLPWFLPLLVIGAVSFGIGVLAFARGIAQSGVLSPWATRLVAAALVIMAAARFAPFSAVQFYVQGVAGIVALLPLAAQMWRQPEPRRAPSPRAVPAIPGEALAES